MTSIRTVSLDDDVTAWLSKNFNRGEISHFINSLVRRDMGKNENVDLLMNDLNHCIKSRDALDKEITDIQNRILILYEKEKKVRELASLQQLEKIQLMKKEELEKEKKIIKFVSNLKGIKDVKNDFQKKSKVVDVKWFISKVDELNSLNPSKKVDITSLKLYLNKKL